MSWLQEPFDFDLSLKIIADVLYDFFSRIVDPFFFFLFINKDDLSIKSYCIYKINKIIHGCL